MNFSLVWPPENFSRFSNELLQRQSETNNQYHCNHKLDTTFWILNGVLGLVIIFGNSFTCVVFSSSSYLRQNYVNIYLISLGVADISMGILVVPGYASFCTGCAYKWSKFCWFFASARDFAFPATVLNLLAITYDRHLAVIRPLYYASTMTKRKVYGILIAVWITPFVVSLVRNIWQHSWEGEASKRAEKVYNAILSTVFGIIPIPLLLFVNLKVMKAINRHRRRIHAGLEQSLSFTYHTDRGLSEGKRVTFTDSGFARSNINGQTRRNMARKKRGTMSCVLIVLLFTVSWIPRVFFDLCSLLSRDDLTSPLLNKLSLFFIIFQSSVNPFVYSFYRNDFRQAAKRLIKNSRVAIH